MRLILICAVVAPLILTAWGNAQDNPVKVDAKKLIGKWKATDKEGKAANMFAEFKADGKLSTKADFNGKTFEVLGTYKVEGNKLLMKMMIEGREEDEEDTILKLTDDALATRSKNGKELTFERVKAKKGDAQDKPVKVDAKKLVGNWKATDEKGKAANTFAEFKADGKMSVTADFNGKTFVVPGTYKVDGNKLLMKMMIGDQEMDDEATILKLTDDVLMTTEKNGKKLTFERVKAKQGAGSLFGQDGARAIIEKAIQAQGGEKQIAKLRIMRIKVEGKMDLAPALNNLPFVIEDTWQMPGQYKATQRIQLKKDMAYAHTIVFDGDKGWKMVDGKVSDLPKDELTEVHDQKQGEDLDRLGFLNEKGRELAVLDEIKIAGKPAVGVLVKTTGQRDVKLYFEKSSGLLVKRERRVAGPKGKELLQEVFFSDYQEKNGLKHYRKISALHDGQKLLEATVTELEFFEKLDPKVFAKP